MERSDSSPRLRRPSAVPLGWGVRSPLRRGEVSRVPSRSASAMPRALTPPRSPALLPYRAPTVAFQEADPVGPRTIVVSRLNLSLPRGNGLVVSLSTLSRSSSRTPAQDSLRRGWLGLRRWDSHPRVSVGFVSAHQPAAQVPHDRQIRPRRPPRIPLPRKFRQEPRRDRPSGPGTRLWNGWHTTAAPSAVGGAARASFRQPARIMPRGSRHLPFHLYAFRPLVQASSA